MEDTELRWSSEQVLALAPDAASRKAGSTLGKPGRWSGTGSSASGTGGGQLVWGVCAGSGRTPYRTVADLGGLPTTGPAAKCSCPSRKFPCKHVLGLLLLWSAGFVGQQSPPGGETDQERGAGTADGPDAQPDWVRQWRAARQAAATRRQAKAAGAGGPGAADPQAAQRRAERRAERVSAGAAELEQRLADQMRTGLATAGQADQHAWDEIAARMIDAQAPGFAARVRELSAIPASGGDWPSRLLAESSLLHLLARGYLARAGLPPQLAATVRSRVGFTVDSAELLAGPTVRDHWLVIAQQDSADGGLTTRRIWLRGVTEGRPAVLLSFGAAGRAPELSLPVGAALDAELAYHPGSVPLRAVLGMRHGTPAPGRTPPGTPVGEALSAYGSALRHDPWLEDWPVVLAGVVPVPTDSGWQLADADGPSALPVDPRRPARPGLWRLAAVSGGGPVTVFGCLGHRGFTPLTTWQCHGAGQSETVPL